MCKPYKLVLFRMFKKMWYLNCACLPLCTYCKLYHTQDTNCVLMVYRNFLQTSPFKNPFEEIKKYFHTLMEKIFIFLHANLQAKILLNKMQSLIFPIHRQNRSLLFSMAITTVNLSQQQHPILLYSWVRGWKTIHAIYPVLAVSQDCYVL